MTYIVEVRYSGSDWADLLADMRSWLDRRQIEAEEFDPLALGSVVTVRVGFHEKGHAAAFATAFSGRLQLTRADRTVAREMPPSAGNGDGTAFSTDATPPDAGQPSPPASHTEVSLMITHQQKADLRDLGYTDEQIRDMKPEEAHRVLGLID